MLWLEIKSYGVVSKRFPGQLGRMELQPSFFLAATTLVADYKFRGFSKFDLTLSFSY